VEKDGDGFTLIGPLTIRDVTREVKIPFRVVTPESVDQFRHTRITFTGGFTINRKDYGVIYTDAPFWDRIASDDIRIEIDLSVRIYNYLDSVFPKWRTENSVGKLAMQIVEERNVEAARTQLLQWWSNNRKDYDFRPSQLYRAGMMLFQKGQFRDAIGILEVAAEIYRDSAEDDDVAALFAILGEAHARVGDRAKAVLILTKALSLDSRNLRAAELVRQLKN
jgi:tetratricopeptide (TPR) repeat protein